MYTHCVIQFIDDKTTWDVIIKATDAVEENEYDDEQIFFYGMSRDELLKACETGEVCEGEWVVLAVGDTYDSL